MVGFDQRNYHHCYDVWEHTLHAMAAVGNDPALRCAVLLHDIGKTKTFTLDAAGVGHFYGHSAKSRELADDMLRRLKYSNEQRETILKLIDWHDREIALTERGIGRALRVLGEEDLRRLLQVKRADNLGQAPAFHIRQAEVRKAEEILDQLLAEQACFSLKQMAVNGRDLLALGLQGPAIGAMLERLLDGVVDGKLPNEREALLHAAEQMKENV